jgi:hypothetical protein
MKNLLYAMTFIANSTPYFEIMVAYTQCMKWCIGRKYYSKILNIFLVV